MTTLNFKKATFEDFETLENDLEGITVIGSDYEHEIKTFESSNKTTIAIGGALIVLALSNPAPALAGKTEFSKSFNVPSFTVEELVSKSYELDECLSLSFPFIDEQDDYNPIDQEERNDQKDIIRAYQKNMKGFIGLKGKRTPV